MPCRCTTAGDTLGRAVVHEVCVFVCVVDNNVVVENRMLQAVVAAVVPATAVSTREWWVVVEHWRRVWSEVVVG